MNFFAWLVILEVYLAPCLGTVNPTHDGAVVYLLRSLECRRLCLPITSEVGFGNFVLFLEPAQCFLLDFGFFTGVLSILGGDERR